MPIRITGMNSGLDTDSIIQALMSAYRVKGDKYKKEQTKVSWRQDKWKALNSKVYSLYKSLDSLRFSTGYNLKKVTVSDSSKATVSGASNAVNGTRTMKINQLAQAAYLTGDKISAENGKTALSDLISTADGTPYGGGTIRISGNGKTKDIEVTGDTTVNDFIKQLNESGTGVSASYDNTNKRIYISSKKTGAAAGFELSVFDEAGSKALAALGLDSDKTISFEEKIAWEKYYKTATPPAAGSTIDGAPETIEANLKKAIQEIVEAKTELENQQALRDEELLDQKFNGDTKKYLEARKSLIEAQKYVGMEQDDASAMAQLLKMSEKNRAKEYVMEDGKLREKKDGDTGPIYKLTTTKNIMNADGTVGAEITASNPAGDSDRTGINYTFTKITDPTDTTKNSTRSIFILDKYEDLDESIAPGLQTEKDSFDNLNKYAANNNVVKNYEKAADADIEAGDYGKHNVIVQTNAAAIENLEDAIKEYDASLNSNKTNLKAYDSAIKAQKDILENHAVLNPDEIDVDMYNSSDTEERNKYVNTLLDKLTYKVKDFNENYKDVDIENGKQVYKKKGTNSGAKMVQGTDAEIELNGVSYTSSSNSFNINGLSIQAQAKTNGDEITVTTATDTQGIYDKIKDFISEYNSVIAEISSLYNAESAKGYEPLTSEEKEAMSDKEVEEWEAKVKGALLRRDDSLGSLMNMMTSAMLSSVKVGDKSYSLASLGIKTTGYFHTTAESRNQFHIDGDEDDDTTSSKTNTLMNMLNSDPDKVIDTLKGVTGSLYKSLNKKIMSSNRLKSINSIYNDKEMSQSYSDYTKTISAWEEKIQKIEDSYYKKFSAMEVALSKLQSQQSSLAGLLGQ